MTAALARASCRRLQILFDGVPTHAQMLFDLANGPALRPIQVMQIVDLVGGEHGSFPFMGQKAMR
jgi:hypothetical protein